MLTTLIAGLASGETMLAVQRARTAAIVYLLAGVAGVCGLIFLIVAAYLWAAVHIGPIGAALAFAGGFILLAVIVLVTHRVTAGMRARRIAERRKSDIKALGIAAGIAALPTLLRGKGGLGLLVGPAIALAAYAIYRENSKPDPTSED